MSSKLDLNVESNKYVPLPVPIAITEQKWPEGTVPLVCTRTMTYNHEDYIRDCIEGILMQKTTFPVRVCIHDDASTDKTPAIVREYQEKYPNLIWAYYQEENSYKSPEKHKMRSEFMSWAIEGNYQALCEGDDYWTDPLKLQKQVNFLEKNPDYVMTHHAFYTKNKSLNTIKNKTKKSIISLEDYLKGDLDGGMPKTLTIMIRAFIFEVIEVEYLGPDTVLCATALNHGKAYYDDSPMGVYRVHESGVWSSINKKSKLRHTLNCLDKIITYYKDANIGSKFYANYIFCTVSLFKDNDLRYPKDEGYKRNSIKILRNKNFILISFRDRSFINHYLKSLLKFLIILFK